MKLSKNRLRVQYLPDSAACFYVRVTVEDRLAGNAFACRWSCEGKIVCWVTQLVVHSDFRERGLAVGLLNQLRKDDDAIYGLMSSILPPVWRPRKPLEVRIICSLPSQIVYTDIGQVA